MASGGKKSAQYICGLIKPIISRIEMTKNSQFSNHTGVLDLLLFDGASNVQKAAQLVSVAYPRITVIHGAEHVVSLFFKDVFTKVEAFKKCLIFLSGAGTSLDQRIMVLMPYSRIIRCFITRTSILAL